MLMIRMGWGRVVGAKITAIAAMTAHTEQRITIQINSVLLAVVLQSSTT